MGISTIGSVHPYQGRGTGIETQLRNVLFCLFGLQSKM